MRTGTNPSTIQARVPTTPEFVDDIAVAARITAITLNSASSPLLIALAMF